MKSHRIYTLAECAQLARVVPRRPRIAVTGTFAALTLALVAAIAWAALTTAQLVVRAPARVRAKHAPQLSFAATSGEQVFVALAGRVNEVKVVSGARVEKGTVLAVLDGGQLENDRSRLEAEAKSSRDARDAAGRMLALARAEFEAAQAARQAELAQVQREDVRQIRRTRADVRLAEAAAEASRRELERVRALVEDGAASEAQLDQATTKASEAALRAEAARVGAAGGRGELLRRQIVLAERAFAVRAEELTQAASASATQAIGAERRLANLALEQDKATIRAGTTGTITSVGIAEGDIVQAGQAVFAIAPDDGVRLDAAVAVGDVGELRIGMRVRIRVDGFDWQRYGMLGGTIVQISADAEQLASGGQSIPHYVIRIEPDRDELTRGSLRGRLKLGMSATVDIVTGERRMLWVLVGQLRQAVSL